MLRIILAIAIVITTATAKQGIRLRQITPDENNTIVIKEYQGTQIPIICAKSEGLQFCMFTEPNSTTMINIDPETMKLFSNPIQPIMIHPDNNCCGILIPKIKPEHEGTWECQVYRPTKDNKKAGTTYHGRPMARVNRFFKIEIRHNQTQHNTVQTRIPSYRMIPTITIAIMITTMAAIAVIIKQTKGHILQYRVL